LMPLKVTVRNKILTLTYKNDKETAEASFRIHPDATDEEILATVRRFLTFAEAQMGIRSIPMLTLPEAQDTGRTVPATGPTPLSATAIAASPSPVAGTDNLPRLQMMPPASLSGTPSDGGPAKDMNEEFWKGMPTLQVPGELASGAMGWEMDP